MKKIIFLSIILLIVIVIYYMNIDNKTFLVHMGNNYVNIDEYVINDLKEKNKYENYAFYVNEKYRIIDLIRAIETNTKINGRNIQNALIKADITIVDIGINEIDSTKIDDQRISELKKDYDTLLSLIRKNTKEKIILFSLYNYYNNSDVDKVNFLLEKICSYYNIDFINISKYVIKNKSIRVDNKYLNNDANQYAYNKYQEIFKN